MKVIKIGGGCLNGQKTIARIVDLIEQRAKGHIVVVSALNGITDALIEGMQQALADETAIAGIMSRIKAKHTNVARHLIVSRQALNDFNKDLSKSMFKLERLFYGLNFTREITPRLADVISSYGERLCAQLLTRVLRSRKVNAVCRMPHHMGMVTDGKFNDATANLPRTEKNLARHIPPLLDAQTVLFIPGFFGVSESGDITTFGRGGSDYSAAVVAATTGAESLEIWKDVDGFMSADPRLEPEAELISALSYEEAAELAYFGAKILHARCVEPARTRKLTIAIKNTLHPEADGSLISANAPKSPRTVKSVAHDTDIAVVKVHASGVGARPGILAQVATAVAGVGVNIRSVITSQTCISLLISRKDVAASRSALVAMAPRPYRRIEVRDDVALIAIVGDGLLKRAGIAAQCFAAVAACNVNVEMISFGPSRAALYFLTKGKDLQKAISAIHSRFFSSPRCLPPGVGGP
ncbi:MAG: aspartate kinase [Desulfobacterales bacterium]|nr:aspartate kinase [Desulfobacterales bacterium]